MYDHATLFLIHENALEHTGKHTAHNCVTLAFSYTNTICYLFMYNGAQIINICMIDGLTITFSLICRFSRAVFGGRERGLLILSSGIFKVTCCFEGSFWALFVVLK